MVKLELPKELEAFRKEIEGTVKPFIRITAEKGETTIYESKFGGIPYIPIGFEYPTNDKGEHLRFIAQINFAEVPPMEPYPEKGILQFFIASDDMFGMDVENGHKVIYHENIVEEEFTLKDVSFAKFEDCDYFIFDLDLEAKLLFNLESEPISTSDFEFDTILGEKITNDEIFIIDGKEVSLYDVYYTLPNSEGHKLGGYPFFTQDDPRYQNFEDYILLFQLDSDHSLDILWGDSGVGNFFVRESDLKKRDFSKVLYNWDCC